MFELTINGKPLEGALQGNYKTIEALAATIAGKAKLLAPFDEGRLRNSIMWKTKLTEGGFNDSGDRQADQKLTVTPKENEGYVGTNLSYAVYQEFGTRNIAPRPYLRPAIVEALGGSAKAEAKRILNEYMALNLKKGKRTKRG